LTTIYDHFMFSERLNTYAGFGPFFLAHFFSLFHFAYSGQTPENESTVFDKNEVGQIKFSEK